MSELPVILCVRDAVLKPLLEACFKGGDEMGVQFVDKIKQEDVARSLWIGHGHLREEAKDFLAQNIFVTPLRFGALLDRMRVLRQQKNVLKNIAIGPYQFDEAAQELVQGDRVIHLTEKEAQILKLLCVADGADVTRDALLTHVWGYGADIETHTLETHIYRLRQKIEQDPGAPLILLTVEQGYKLA